MSPEPTEPPTSPTRRNRWRWWRRVMAAAGAFMLAYLVLAYLVVPLIWEQYVRRHPSLDDVPGITRTAVGIPGDPINVALVGTRAEIERIMRGAGWVPADPITLRSSVEIAADTVLGRPDADAPVSSLYLYGRKEDLAFEKPVGHNPRQRNHVRFWKSDKTDANGRPFWLGAATYDRGVGLSHTTGEVTHHIAPDIDAERDGLMRDLFTTGRIRETYTVEGFHEVLQGRNGGGDRWHTDGDLDVAVIEPGNPATDSQDNIDETRNTPRFGARVAVNAARKGVDGVSCSCGLGKISANAAVKEGKLDCGPVIEVSHLAWKFLEHRNDADRYAITWTLTDNAGNTLKTTKQEVAFSGEEIVLVDDGHYIVLEPLDETDSVEDSHVVE